MRLSLYGFVRVGALLAAASCSVAVAVGKLQPEATRWRLASPPHYGVINGFVLDQWPGAARLLDSGTGEVSKFRAPDGDRFEYGACSPWSDGEGESQVVGRWMRRETSAARPGEKRFEAFGLARYSLPSGRVLNRLALDAVPSTHPCWFPDMTARVIYTGGDGRIYCVDFDEAERSGVDDPAPREVLWRCKRPGEGLMVRDPVWSSDSRLGGRLVASVQYRVEGREHDLTMNRLWWFQLSSDGVAITAAGPLTDPETGLVGADVHEERFPNIAKAPDGRLMLAYMTRGPREPLWTLRLGTLDLVDDASAPPVVHGKESRVLAKRQAGELTPFSADGRGVFGVAHDESVGRLVRYPTDVAAAG
jgi:hypothetical protein